MPEPFVNKAIIRKVSKMKSQQASNNNPNKYFYSALFNSSDLIIQAESTHDLYLYKYN